MLEIINVSHRYGQEPVLTDIDLIIEQGEIVCLLGESGSGKTTLLRIIAGLEDGYQGKVIVSGKDMRHVPIHQRGFGLMFQDFALFPHMNVVKNVAFGLRMQGVRQNQQKSIVSEMLNLVGLSGYENRDINSLSGGQKQRVALARSLAPKPSLLMLDEPLGSLDAGLRENLVGELRDIIKQIGLTAIYVTHDQQEAYRIADHIAVMNGGQIEQIGQPEQLYYHPKTEFVARFLGMNNIVPRSFLEKHFDISVNGQTFLLHPNALTFDVQGQVEGQVVERVFQGHSYKLKVLIDDRILVISIPSSKIVPPRNETIRLSIDVEALQALS